MTEGDEADRSIELLAADDRRAHERRLRPPRDVRLARGGGGALRALARPARARSSAATSSNRSTSGSPFPASTTGGTRRRARRARARRCVARRRCSGARAVRGCRPPVRAPWRSRRRHGDQRLRPPPGRDRGDDRDRPRARGRQAGARSSSGRFSTRARATWPTSSPARSRPRTSWPSPTCPERASPVWTAFGQARRRRAVRAAPGMPSPGRPSSPTRPRSSPTAPARATSSSPRAPTTWPRAAPAGPGGPPLTRPAHRRLMQFRFPRGRFRALPPL